MAQGKRIPGISPEKFLSCFKWLKLITLIQQHTLTSSLPKQTVYQKTSQKTKQKNLSKSHKVYLKEENVITSPVCLCQRRGRLTENSQPGWSGSNGRLNGLALIQGVILEIRSEDFQVMLPRQMVSNNQIAWIACRKIQAEL